MRSEGVGSNLQEPGARADRAAGQGDVHDRPRLACERLALQHLSRAGWPSPASRCYTVTSEAVKFRQLLACKNVPDVRRQIRMRHARKGI